MSLSLADENSRTTTRNRLKDFGKPPRIMGLDIARAIAIIGMIAAHTAVLQAELDWGQPATWSALANGRPSMLFALLGGISIALMSGGAAGLPQEKVAETRVKLVARGLAIFAIGFFLELLGTPILVILGLYGVLYVLVLPFLRWKRRYLLLASLVLMLLGPMLLIFLQYSLMSSGTALNLVLQGSFSLAGWMSLLLLGLALGRSDLSSLKTALLLLPVGLVLAVTAYSASAALGTNQGSGAVAGAIAKYSVAEPSLVKKGSILGQESDIDMSQENLEGYICDRWFDGMITCTPEENYLGSAGDDMGGSSSMPFLNMDEGLQSQWPQFAERMKQMEGSMFQSAFFNTEPHSGGSLEILGSAGIGLLVLGLSLLAGRWLRVLMLPLAALGAMPLTIYALHIITIWAFTGPNGTVSDNTFFGFLVLGLLVFALAWTALLGRGPLERFPLWAAKKLTR